MHAYTECIRMPTQVCVKTLISVQPHLEATYFTCRQRSDDAGSGCFEVCKHHACMHARMQYMLDAGSDILHA